MQISCATHIVQRSAQQDECVASLSQNVGHAQSVLDVGCGFCWLGDLLRIVRPDIRYTGLTNSREMAAFCRHSGHAVHRADFLDFLRDQHERRRRFDAVAFVESFFYLGKTLKSKVDVLNRTHELASKIVGVFLTHRRVHAPARSARPGRS